MPLFAPIRVLIRGAGDLATGVALRLHRCGFQVVMTELAEPLAVRRTVAFAQAVYDGAATVEGVTARRVEVADVHASLGDGVIPVVLDPHGWAIAALLPDVVVDARMAKRNLGTTLDDASLVVALGPGFVAGEDCHVVVETNRGHDLGRVIWVGSAEPDTGVPGSIGGADAERVLRAPVDGVVTAVRDIGDVIRPGEVVAIVGDAEVAASIGGVLRGMLHDGLRVTAGTKLGDIDPRAAPSHVHTVSDKSLAIAGGVLEAMMSVRRL